MIFSSGSGPTSGATFVGATPAEDLPQDVRESVLEVPVCHDVYDGVQG